MCDEIIEETKTVPTIFNKKKVTCKIKSFYILLAFLLITLVLLIVATILLLLHKILSIITISRHKQQIKRKFTLII